MSIAKILVPMTGIAQDLSALSMAMRAAEPLRSHVAALLVVPDPCQSLLDFAAPLPGNTAHRILLAAEDLNAAATRVAEATLRKAAASSGVPILDRAAKVELTSCSFTAMEGHFTDCIMRASPLSDLIVFGTPGTARIHVRDCFVDVLMNARRPVLISPSAMSKPIQNIAIGWDGSAPAANAVMAAVPLLAHAAQVVILNGQFASDRRRNLAHGSKPECLEQYLSLHGISAAHVTLDFESDQPGASLLDAARGYGADLLIMGGYGHGSFWETLVGGVTEDIRGHTDIAVLMAH